MTGDAAMAPKTVAGPSPGDMGHNVGKTLHKEGPRTANEKPMEDKQTG